MTQARLIGRPLEGKVAVVYSGAPGWAGPVIHALTEAGAAVALAAASPEAVPPDPGHQVASLLEGPFNNAGAVEAAIGRVIQRLGRFDILVNLPQPELFQPASEVSDEAFSGLFGRNVASVYRWSRAAGAHMSRQKSGRIITFTSGLSRRGLVNGCAFSMTQAALDAMTRSLALEWAAAGVRVNGIGYGWVEPARRPLEDQQKERLVRFLPLRRKGHPDDLMGLLVYLASDASSFVTGQTIFVDGGAMAHA
jgi:NAD(P)-dependent dehydrogenase (short-subunit alcohol dehydrogenase family)